MNILIPDISEDNCKLKNIVRLFSEVEKSWLACALDGEGCLGQYEYNEGRRISIQIGNTNRDFVEEFKRIIGCGSSVMCYKRPFTNPSHYGKKPMYYYQLNGSKRCAEVLIQILPYLIIKKEKANNILLEMELRPFGAFKHDIEESKKRTSLRVKKEWEDPDIRARRIKGMQGKLRKERCKRGHLRTPENLYGSKCKTCQTMRNRGEI